MSKPIKTLIGFVVLMVVLLPIGGPIIFLASVVCTLGLGLIIWIPLSYATGSFTLWLVDAWFGKPKPTQIPQKALTKEETALINYANQAKQNGMPESDIFLRLREKGWAESQILSALGKESAPQESKKETQPIKPDRTKAIIVALILILVVGGIYFFNALNRSQSKAKQSDQQRINDIYNLKYAIENYYSQNGKLPATLSDTTLSYYGYVADPKTGQPYQYQPTTDTYYKLCATFDTSSSENRGSYGSTDQPYYHPQGYYCFNLQIPYNQTKNKTNPSNNYNSPLNFLPNKLFSLRCVNLNFLGLKVSKNLAGLIY
ncbi:MAG: hypothetical protein WD231_01270 [Candidatus Woykebacteria bacterium]